MAFSNPNDIHLHKNSYPQGTIRKSRANKRRRVRRKAGARKGSAVKGAQGRLRQFRQASLLAVAITGFLIILMSPGEAGLTPVQQKVENIENGNGTPDTVYIIEEKPVEELIQRSKPEVKDPIITSEELGEATIDQALTTLRNLWEGFFFNLPKMVVAIITLIIAWLLVRFARIVLRKTIGRWRGIGGITVLTAIVIWLFAIGVAVSIVAGDIRALLGSLGLVGLALSWSLQTPIESFTAWLLNSFKLYYKIGDRIQVGDVFGDVYKIDFITTTVWEIGAPHRAGFVMAEQPTGRLVTFPNNEILSGSIVNLTKDFPYVWDELNISIANESDVRFSIDVIKKTASNVLGDNMKEPAQHYEEILQKAGLSSGTHENPQVYVASSESWMDIIIRYIVGASERRKWKSELTIAISDELNKKEYKDKIKPVYPRRQVQFIDPEGTVVEKK